MKRYCIIQKYTYIILLCALQLASSKSNLNLICKTRFQITVKQPLSIVSTFSSSSLVSASHIHNYTVPRYLKRPFAISRNHYHYHYTTCASQLQNINLFHSPPSTSKISVLVWWDIPYIPPHSNKRKDKNELSFCTNFANSGSARK